MIHVHQTAGEFGQGGGKSKDTALIVISIQSNKSLLQGFADMLTSVILPLCFRVFWLVSGLHSQWFLTCFPKIQNFGVKLGTQIFQNKSACCELPSLSFLMFRYQELLPSFLAFFSSEEGRKLINTQYKFCKQTIILCLQI